MLVGGPLVATAASVAATASARRYSAGSPLELFLEAGVSSFILISLKLIDWWVVVRISIYLSHR